MESRLQPISRADRIIVALDFDCQDDALRLVERLSPATFFKVGPRLLAASSWGIVNALAEMGKKIFLDLKLHDIPTTVGATVTNLGRYPVTALSVHACTGSETLKSAVRSARSLPSPIQIWAVTLLTSLSDSAFVDELMINGSPGDYVEHLAVLSRYCGADGVVAPATETSRIKEVCGNEFVVVVPGIRPSGTRRDDQSRLATPAEAIRAGADFLVVGRAITASHDPVAAFLRIVDEMSSAG